jgi:hypothetical protein
MLHGNPAQARAWVVGDEPWIGIAWSGIRSFGAPLLATEGRVLTTVLFTDIVDPCPVGSRPEPLSLPSAADLKCVSQR